MKYIQSFYQYPVTFSSIGKTIPARNAVGEMKNIAEVSEAELAKLETKEPFFRELVNKKKIRVLNKVPSSYVPPAQQINEAHAEAEALKAGNEILKAENEELRAKLAALESAENKESEEEGKEPETEEATTEESSEVVDYDKMTYAELQETAKAAGLEYKNVKKAELLEQLKAL